MPFLAIHEILVITVQLYVLYLEVGFTVLVTVFSFVIVFLFNLNYCNPKACVMTCMTIF